jgi:GABA permease
MNRYLVVGNQTLDSDVLADQVRERMARGPAEFWLAVPATPVKDLASNMVAIPMPVMGGVLRMPEPPQEARRLAQAKLDAALRKLTALGATVDGAVTDADPMRAVEEAMSNREFDEIIVSTLPRRLSRWLHQDLPDRLQDRFGVPVTDIVAEDV